MENEATGALRVSQLDASELDHEIVQLTKSQISQLFKYHQSTFLAHFDPEIQAGIKLLLWKFALFDRDATVGQQILGIHYGKGKGTNLGAPITGREKVLYGLLVVLFPWLKERISTLLTYIGLSQWDTQVHFWLQQVETVWKAAALVNLLVFLKKGVYLSLVERILGIRSQFPQRQGLRQGNIRRVLTRELLWHGFAEFLFFLLPLINFQRIKNSFKRWLGGQKLTSQGHLKSRTRADLMTCAVCEEWPVMPREIGCRHVFCYYCISANLSADPNFSCPQCGHPVVSQSNIQVVKSHINPGQAHT
ncbi:unnamed protein product [Candidula unifasciata]|uniref:Peroxisome biogenesis factor 2 n=1 Tax=Candidula unifasciata TaxID=100452 RepID=A0A8S3YXM5_9EUPU|nr:unnamed protein product [Candidula unifasciata]